MNILAHHNIPQRVLDIISHARGGTTWIRDTDVSFEAKSGLASPLLFALALNAALRESSLGQATYNALS